MWFARAYNEKKSFFLVLSRVCFCVGKIEATFEKFEKSIVDVRACVCVGVVGGWRLERGVLRV